MTIDIIIATYNRAARAARAAQQFLDLEERFFERVIIVDSSDDVSHADYPADPQVTFVHSSHKSQPYQRFLGCKLSRAEVLLYLDDDVDLIDEAHLLSALARFENPGVVGINFDWINRYSFYDDAPQTFTPRGWGCLGRFASWLSGSPEIADNRFWLCGLRGKRKGGAPIEYLYGCAFAVRRAAFYVNFNCEMFEQFEIRLGMGEDVTAGYGLSRQGLIWAEEGKIFNHDNQGDSTYTVDLRNYNYRTAFSRLFLSLEYARLSGGKRAFAIMHYHWFMIWRTLSLVAALCFDYSKQRLEILKGWLAGWAKTVVWQEKELSRTADFWYAEMEKDLRDA